MGLIERAIEEDKPELITEHEDFTKEQVSENDSSNCFINDINYKTIDCEADCVECIFCKQNNPFETLTDWLYRNNEPDVSQFNF